MYLFTGPHGTPVHGGIVASRKVLVSLGFRWVDVVAVN